MCEENKYKPVFVGTHGDHAHEILIYTWRYLLLCYLLIEVH